MVKTRIAPSPTGDPHIGTAYTALFNYAFAKKEKGKFVIRIEDTDRTRFIPESENKIIEALKWLGLNWDEGPYRQSERLKLYKKAAEDLVKKEAAYYCNCSVQRLEKLRKAQQARKEITRYDKKCLLTKAKEGPFVIRLKVPETGETSFEDLIRGKITFKNKDIDDAVILKSDGWPTYHLAVVVDDSDMGITHVIRAEEWLSSTPKHVLLYEAFRKKLPKYVHLPLLRNSDKSKISKRKNSVSLTWYKEQGYLPEAILNFLGLMGWSMPDGREKFTLDDFIENFDLSRLDPVGPVFDLQKLNWLNGEWIRSFSEKKLTDRLTDYTKISPGEIKRVLPLIQERLKKLSEFDTFTYYFFSEKLEVKKNVFLQKGKSTNDTISILKNIVEALKKTEKWDKDTIEETLDNKPDEFGWTKKDLFQTIRGVVTGSNSSPPLFETIETIGKKKVLARIEYAIDLLDTDL